MERKKRGFYLIKKGSVAVQNVDWGRDLCVIGSIVRVPFISGRQPFSIVNRPPTALRNLFNLGIRYHTSSFNRLFLSSR